ncbi:GPW/gp25 family protein [Sphingomonas sp. PAMC 26605]|uniref:GPW/gp25 family protein n=1 Tax=Sphingomonas sp. PAMC 26605 TaxID=1112214 RepID=UPI00026CCA48|nr:GPW/gp25 family protein [Sphingomonas sp. PAMC 26605]
MSDPDPLGQTFLGRGWAYPFRLLPGSGRVDTVAYDDDVRQSIRIILGTAKGERVMRPDFGCGIHDRVFAAISSATIEQIKRDVAAALRRYEARIDVLAIDVDTGPLLYGRLDVTIAYRVRNTNQSDNLVYPFYYKEAR